MTPLLAIFLLGLLGSLIIIAGSLVFAAYGAANPSSADGEAAAVVFVAIAVFAIFVALLCLVAIVILIL